MICWAAVIGAMLATPMHRPADLIAEVYWMAGLEGVAVVEYESRFNPCACKREVKGGTSWGLWQLWDRYHKQYRSDALLHMGTGSAFWKNCMAKGGTVARAYSIYNGGNPYRSIAKGRAVKRKLDSLTLFVWRHLR
jgi:hypothetical protein